MKCGACARGGLRSTQRALILAGPGRMKAGKVCRACASSGWLLVIGDDRPMRKRVAAHAQGGALRRALERIALADVVASARAITIEPWAERCEAQRFRVRSVRCVRAVGHEGAHQSVLGASWEAP